MAVIMFQPQFHKAVESGEKRQTIRPPRKRPIKAGQELSLRAWTGKPYRSAQREIKKAVCQSIEPIRIDETFSDDDEARRDGFSDAEEMREWFRSTHGLPFSGDRIRWA